MIIVEPEEMDELKKTAHCSIRTYAGYKGDETPRSLVSGNREWTIDSVLSRRRVIDSESGQKWEEFECRVGEEIIKIRLFSTGEAVHFFPR